jgi:hypothetical protein
MNIREGETTMRIRQLSIVILLGFLWTSCELTESPLSDVPISEPSVIRVVAEADRDVGTTNYTSSRLMVSLYDKHEEFIELKQGSVSVNGLPMAYSGFGEYIRTNEAVRADADYTFVITLSDGSQHSCGVHTPKNLNQLTVPATYDRKSNLVVSWQTPDPAAVTTLILSGDTVTTRYQISQGAGSVSLPPSSLAKFHGGQTLSVEILEVRSGHLDGGFMSTSTVTASFSISRSMRI